MGSITIQCPVCHASLKTGNRNLMGTRVSCPKCQHTFVVEAAHESKEDVIESPNGVTDSVPSVTQTEGMPSSDVAVPELPQDSHAAPHLFPSEQRPRKKGVLIAGGLLAAVLAVALIWGAIHDWSDSGGKSPLAYIPADAELIMVFRLADVWSSPFLESIVSHTQIRHNVWQMRGQIGLGPEDIQRVVIGVTGLSRLREQTQAGSGMPGGMPSIPSLGGLDGSSGVIVVHTTKDIDHEKLIRYAEQLPGVSGSKIQEMTHNSQTYFRVANRDQQGARFLALFLPDRRTIVAGPEEDVVAAINRGGQAESRPELDFLDFDQHVLIAIVPQDLSIFGKDGWQFGDQATPSVEALQQSLGEAVRATSFGISFVDGVDFRVQLDCLDAGKAEQLEPLMNNVLAELRDEFGSKLAEAQTLAPMPLLGELVASGQQLLDSLQSERAGTTVAVTAALPASTRETIGRIPDAIAGMFRYPQIGPGAGTDMAGDFSFPPMSEELPPEPLEAVSLADYDAAWQIQLDVSDLPAGQLLQDLADEMGVTFKPVPEHQTALAKLVTVQIDSVSRLEAIEEICRQIGKYPHFPQFASNTMTLRDGSRPWPSLFAGPFLVEVADLEELVPYAAGILRVTIVAEGLPAKLAARASEGMDHAVGFTQILDAQGNSLRDSGGGTMYGLSTESSLYNQTFHLSLKNLLRNVDCIQTIDGSIRFSIPTRIETLEFKQLAKDEMALAGDVQLKITDVQLDDSSSFTFEFEGTDMNSFEFVAYDADGQLLSCNETGGYGSDGKGVLNISIEGKPEKLEARIIMEKTEVDYPFSLPAIPLAAHQQMPEQIEPIEFTGDRPIVFEFARFAGEENFRKVVFEVTNHANKPIRDMVLNMAFLDADGNALKEMPHIQSGTENLPDAQATSEIEIAAFFMPEETATVTAELRRVKFADASVWDSEDIFTDEHVPYAIGSAKLNLSESGTLRAGYTGLDHEGKPKSAMAGVTDLGPGDGSSSVATLSHKPRITRLRIADSTACKFSHVQLDPGTYLVYLLRGDRNCDWQWITVDDQTKLELDFEIDDAETGSLELTLPDDPKFEQAELIPLDADGDAPIPLEDLSEARIGYWLGMQMQLEEGRAVLDGLRPGKYRVLCGDKTIDVEVVGGETATASLPAADEETEPAEEAEPAEE